MFINRSMFEHEQLTVENFFNVVNPQSYNRMRDIGRHNSCVLDHTRRNVHQFISYTIEGLK